MAFGPGLPVSTTPNLKFRPTSPMPRIGFRVDPNKVFFDRKVVIDAVGRATAKAMSISSLAIKRSAKRSMKLVSPMPEQLRQKALGKRKRFSKIRPASPPGFPPRAILPDAPVRKLLWNLFDRRTRSAIVGPAKFPTGSTMAPSILEHGGPTKKKKNTRRTKRKLGGSGEIRLGGRVSRSTKSGVTYGRLTTPRMVRRANVLNEELYGPEFMGGTMQRARPFMKPALKKEVPNMARRWQASVHP